ncbi:MAG: MFS transporter [Alphaproteobacteria bacterium]|nr:MAG: MFS transporter [Alphaproteobacteria bacterium]
MSRSVVQGGWAVLRLRKFRLALMSRFLLTIAFQMLGVAVGWQVYAITGDPLDLGWVGLVQFVPILLLGLLGGHVADNFNRIHVLTACLGLVLVCCVALSVLAMSEVAAVWPILMVLAMLSVARAFYAPTAQALLSNIVSQEQLPNAVGWWTTVWQIATVAGPAAGGLVLIAGSDWVYACAALLTGLSISLMVQIRIGTRPRRREPVSWAALTGGLRYVWSNKVILGAISLDLVAVLLGGVTALLPIFATDILGVGPVGYGWLRSAPAVGAVCTGLVLAQFPIRRKIGRTMIGAVAVYGVATLVFGLSELYVLSLAMLAVAGAADMVSVFVRHNLIQLATPDEMRGQVAAVSSVFIVGSNELGEFESGALAALIGVVPCVIVGAVGTLVVTGASWVLFPELRRTDRPRDAFRAALPSD